MSRKRRRRKLSRMSFICVATIVSLSLLGIGYGYWSNGLDIGINITTGSIDPQAFITNYSSLNITSSEDGRTIKISGDMYQGANEELRIKIINNGSVPVRLKDISTVSSSEIVDLTRQSNMGYGLFSLSQDEVVEEFQLNISHIENYDESSIATYTFTIEESLEVEDEIQRKINAAHDEIRQLENEIDRLNVIENHNFKYELLFMQGL